MGDRDNYHIPLALTNARSSIWLKYQLGLCYNLTMVLQPDQKRKNTPQKAKDPYSGGIECLITCAS